MSDKCGCMFGKAAYSGRRFGGMWVDSPRGSLMTARRQMQRLLTKVGRDTSLSGQEVLLLAD